MKPHQNSSRITCRLFLFTEQDELRIARAKREALRFMLTYGKGRQPVMIHRENYY